MLAARSLITPRIVLDLEDLIIITEVPPSMGRRALIAHPAHGLWIIKRTVSAQRLTHFGVIATPLKAAPKTSPLAISRVLSVPVSQDARLRRASKIFCLYYRLGKQSIVSTRSYWKQEIWVEQRRRASRET